MSVIADAGTLRYLLELGQERHLETLFGKVEVPDRVLFELSNSPKEAVSKWAKDPPPWVVRLSDKSTPLFPGVELGERQVLTHALERGSTQVLIDERKPREIADRTLGIKVSGTLGILRQADEKLEEVDFEKEARRYQQTNAWISKDIVEDQIRQHRAWELQQKESLQHQQQHIREAAKQKQQQRQKNELQKRPIVREEQRIQTPPAKEAPPVRAELSGKEKAELRNREAKKAEEKSPTPKAAVKEEPKIPLQQAQRAALAKVEISRHQEKVEASKKAKNEQEQQKRREEFLRPSNGPKP